MQSGRRHGLFLVVVAFEDGQQLGEHQQILEPLGHAQQLQRSAIVTGRGVDLDELSEPGAHSVVGVIHMLGAAEGRFKTGGTVIRAGTGTRPAADIYNTVLRAYGAKRVMAPGEFKGEIAEMRA